MNVLLGKNEVFIILTLAIILLTIVALFFFNFNRKVPQKVQTEISEKIMRS